MGDLIRVEDVPPRDRLDYLRHAVADTFVPFDLRIDAGDELHAQILTGQVGDIQVSRVSAPPLAAFRTAKLVRVSDPAAFKLEVPERGHTIFAQGDREASLTPGGFTLLDLSRPCSLADRGDQHGLVAIKFPHTALPLPHDEVFRLTAVPMPGDDGLGGAIASLARYMVRHLDDDPTNRARLAASLLDLLAVALAERLERSSTLAPATYRRALLTRVWAFIDQHLADPRLSPSMIAAAHHISLRTLYNLFETQPTSVSGWIRQRRLERCRRDLVDPALADRPVGAIAARWGLLDAAHFSRLFSAAYGVSPTDYRRTHGITGPGTSHPTAPSRRRRLNR